jgi:pyruvate dehydrogenase E2 component (dihydrolipoamide acetyltransferase)
LAEERKVLLPDIGDFENVDIVEILVSPGDRVAVDDSLVVLETDKATMEIPAPFAGVISQMNVRIGDTISEGGLVCVIEVDEDSQPLAPPAAEEAEEIEEEPAAPEEREEPEDVLPSVTAPAPTSATAHASPGVRRLARELGIDLTLVAPSGRKGRVLKEDVQGYVKGMMAKGTSAGVPISGVRVGKAPEIDFAKFGPIEIQPLNTIRKLSGANLHRSWVSVPHVTQFDEADVTELEAFRKAQKAEAEGQGVKLTFLPFVMKAIVAGLGEFPHFNSSLDKTGENLIVKDYFHIGVAVDTPMGLVVPAVRDVDQKSILELAGELMELSTKARERKLHLDDLQGGTFTISSLGGIGGTFFTPIVNHPEVAVLGVGRMEWRPVYRGAELERRLILPLSLSYDHRVIDGADAVRFTGRLVHYLSDLRRILL